MKQNIKEIITIAMLLALISGGAIVVWGAYDLGKYDATLTINNHYLINDGDTTEISEKLYDELK